MQTFGDYLRGLGQRWAENHPGTVEAKVDTNVYRVTIDRLGGSVRATVTQPGVNYAPNQAVWVARLTRGLAPNGGWVILGTAAIANRVDAAPLAVTTARSGESVSSIRSGGSEVSRVTLEAGGASVTVLIYGTGLETEATYGDAGITDASAQAFTGTTLLTIEVEAAGGTAAGRYSLTVAGITIPEFFEVV